MKYKVLLFGMNTSAIDDFFYKGNDAFEYITSSLRYEDILNHLKICQPQIAIYCLNQETRENISQTVTLKKQLEKMNIPLIVVGNQEDCESFNKTTINIADLAFVKPLTAGTIQTEILHYMQQRDENPNTISSPTNTPTKPVAEKSVEVETEAETERTRKHVLVIDDNANMLKVIKRHLDGKYDTATAISGLVALRFLRKKKTDLILLDYEMPEMNGPEVLAKLRADEATKNIPVLFLTGTSDKEKIQKALSLKPQGYLLKPIDQNTLLARIREVIGE